MDRDAIENNISNFNFYIILFTYLYMYYFIYLSKINWKIIVRYSTNFELSWSILEKNNVSRKFYFILLFNLSNFKKI